MVLGTWPITRSHDHAEGPLRAAAAAGTRPESTWLHGHSTDEEEGKGIQDGGVKNCGIVPLPIFTYTQGVKAPPRRAALSANSSPCARARPSSLNPENE